MDDRFSAGKAVAAALACIVFACETTAQQFAPVIELAPVTHISADFASAPESARRQSRQDILYLTDRNVRWISEIPWGSEVVQAQFSAGAEQPVDPGTVNVGLLSKPSKNSFRSDFDSVLATTTPTAATQRSAASVAAPETAPFGSPAQAPSSDPTSLTQPPSVQPQPIATTPPAASLSGAAQSAVAATIRATPPSLRSTPAVDVVATREIQILGSSETAEILQESTSVQTVAVQRRSPIDFDPRIRGFKSGQVYTQADGAYWFPARQDLDSILSKLDPSLIQDAIVIPGPYGLRYGPGFGFVNIVTSPTPRYEEGPETHARTGVTVRENGGQLYGRETIYGGSQDWGFILNYGNRTGSDYESGDGTSIPASYHAQNFLAQLGYDTSEHSHWEFRYQRLDQTDTEYAGQFFDLNLLVTDGYNVAYVNEDPCACWERLTVDGWHNRTRFMGDTLNQSKRNFNVINRVERALGLPTDGAPPSFIGNTNGALSSTGTRVETLFGKDGEKQLRLGTDFRRLKQGINEDFTIVGNDPFDTNLPRSTSTAPGIYAEVTVPFEEYFWTSTIGTRVDWLNTNATAGDLRDNTSLPNIDTSREQADSLYAFYLINDVQLKDDWNLRFGFGHAQRAPTPIERYSDGLFLGIIQSGFSRVIGDPNLNKERLWQVDVSTDFDVNDWSFRLSGFHSWILDYVTFTGNVINDPSGARLLRYINTDLATLTGAEFYAEKPLNERLTAFGAYHIVDGRDRDIQRPLFGISPMEGRAGLRLVDRNNGKKWGVEFAARIVDNQDRLGALRIGTTSIVDIIDLEGPTPGFTTFHVRGYYNVTDSLHVVAGINNLFDKNYLEHLSLRLPNVPGFTGTRVLEPGFSPYLTVEWTF